SCCCSTTNPAQSPPQSSPSTPQSCPPCSAHSTTLEPADTAAQTPPADSSVAPRPPAHCPAAAPTPSGTHCYPARLLQTHPAAASESPSSPTAGRSETPLHARHSRSHSS